MSRSWRCVAPGVRQRQGDGWHTTTPCTHALRCSSAPPHTCALAQSLIAECIGTFFYTLMVSLTMLHEDLQGGAVAIGVALASLTYAFGHISEAHFNPAVTLGVCLTGKMQWALGILYIVVQLLGACMGAVTSFILAGSDVTQTAHPTNASGAPLVAAWVLECLFTLAIVLVYLNVATEKNSSEPNSYYGIAIGFTVLAGVSAGFPLNVSVYNPAVNTAMGFLAGITGRNTGMDSIWVYWTAPIVGTVAAALLKVFMNSDWHTQDTARGRLPSVVPVVEFIGTFYLTLVYALNGSSLGVGGILLAMVYMGDHVCGVDFNPAVTVGAALRWGVPLSEYWKVGVTALAQFLGGFGAAFVVYGLHGEVHFPQPGQLSGASGAMAFEVLWTALLVYVVCTVMTPISADPKDVRMLNRRGFTIGFIVASGVYCATKNGTGASGVFNPALGAGLSAAASLLPHDDHTHIGNWWVYVVGPFVGALFGAGVFALLHHHMDPDPTDYDFQGQGFGDVGMPGGGDFGDDTVFGERSGFDAEAFGGPSGGGVPAAMGDSYSTGYVAMQGGGGGGYGQVGYDTSMDA